jgi:hypothetical protein
MKARPMSDIIDNSNHFDQNIGQKEAHSKIKPRKNCEKSVKKAEFTRIQGASGFEPRHPDQRAIGSTDCPPFSSPILRKGSRRISAKSSVCHPFRLRLKTVGQPSRPGQNPENSVSMPPPYGHLWTLVLICH